MGLEGLLWGSGRKDSGNPFLLILSYLLIPLTSSSNFGGFLNDLIGKGG